MPEHNLSPAKLVLLQAARVYAIDLKGHADAGRTLEAHRCAEMAKELIGKAETIPADHPANKEIDLQEPLKG